MKVLGLEVRSFTDTATKKEVAFTKLHVAESLAFDEDHKGTGYGFKASSFSCAKVLDIVPAKYTLDKLEGKEVKLFFGQPNKDGKAQVTMISVIES